MAVNVQVVLDKFTDVDAALRQLKKKTQHSGLWQDMKRHEEYLPPSVRKRDKSAKARAKVRKNQKKRDAEDAKFANVKRRQDDPLRRATL